MITRDRRRHLVNALMSVATFSAALLAVIPLVLIVGCLLVKGLPALSWEFFTALPHPVGEAGGGMANAIVGTIVLVGMACGIGIPIGVLGGIYLAEFGRGWLTHLVRFMADILAGTPSIVIGVFVYELAVAPMRQFSALAGGVALGIIMLPIVLRTTEEMLKLVPLAVREGARALGIPYWRAMLQIVLAAARRGIVTGILLAMARVAGETAPLLFTTLGNQFWSTSLMRPIAALPLQIFTYAISPFATWQTQAWGGALCLVVMIMTTSLIARLAMRRGTRGSAGSP